MISNFTDPATNKSISVQIHLTSKCQYRCKHCYDINVPYRELDVELVKKFISDFIQFCEVFQVKPFIYLTGGDPFLYSNIEHLLFFLRELYSKHYFALGFLTNPDEVHKYIYILSTFKELYVQFSLEGLRDTNDFIRGKGHFTKTVNYIRALKSLNKDITTMIMVTITKLNVGEVSKLYEFLIKEKIPIDFFDFAPYIPSGLLDVNAVPSANEYLNLLDELLRIFLRKYQYNPHIPKIGFKDPLWFVIFKKLNLIKKTISYFIPRCSYGLSTLAIESDGEIYPCRRLAISLGNLNEFGSFKGNIFKEIYFNNATLNFIRKERYTKHNCKACDLFNLCGGGHACLSYALYNSYLRKDPLCPYKTLKEAST